MSLVELGQVRIGHVDLPSHFQQGRRGIGVESQRNVADGTYVVRDIIPGHAIATCDPTDEQPVLVDDRGGHAIDLELHHPGDLFIVHQVSYPAGILFQLLEIVRVVDREHGKPVIDRTEMLYRLVSDSLGRAIRRDQVRVFRLDLRELREKLVVLQVTYFCRGFKVVLSIVKADLLSKRS